MSCQLVWRPIGDDADVGGSLLRDAIRKECGPFPMHLDGSNTQFLRGLVAGGVDGAQELIDAIERHGEIVVDVRC